VDASGKVVLENDVEALALFRKVCDVRNGVARACFLIRR